MELKKELIDQTAHFAVGFVATAVIAVFVNVYISACVVFAFAVSREIYQRLSKNDNWYSCGWGCRLDLMFWAFGIGSAIAAIFITDSFF